MVNVVKAGFSEVLYQHALTQKTNMKGEKQEQKRKNMQVRKQLW